MQIVQGGYVEYGRIVHFPPDPSHPNSNWSQDRVELLKHLWTDGWSGSQIALRLGGVSRCAVLGKVHRLHLPHRVKPRVSERRRRMTDQEKTRLLPFKRPKAPPSAARKPSQRFIVRAIFERINAEPEMTKNLPSILRLDLLDLTADSCRCRSAIQRTTISISVAAPRRTASPIAIITRVSLFSRQLGGDDSRWMNGTDLTPGKLSG